LQVVETSGTKEFVARARRTGLLQWPFLAGDGLLKNEPLLLQVDSVIPQVSLV
jgi:hypothetical protein